MSSWKLNSVLTDWTFKPFGDEDKSAFPTSTQASQQMDRLGLGTS